MTYAILGPKGTFSEEAARLYWEGGTNYIMASNIPELFELVEAGVVTGALVPFENSLIGTIDVTMGCLRERDIKIVGDIYIPINQNIMALKKYELNEIELIVSHPLALLQCSGFIKEHLSHARTEIADSTAKAALIASTEKRKTACIGNNDAASIYNLKIISENIADKGNITRFIHIVSLGNSNTQNIKKASVIFSIQSHPGALYEALGIFAKKGLNLIKIESKIDRGFINSYYFYIEIDLISNNINEFNKAVDELRLKCNYVKSLGEYETTVNLDLIQT